MSTRFDPITLEILWNRLIAIVDESANALIRASFSTVVREAHDFATVIMDAQGNSLAQANLSIPVFIGTLPLTTKYLLKEFPPRTLRPGDVLITNDPWKGPGHLPDVSTVTPIFFKDKLVAFTGTTSHFPDIGGRLRATESREVFEEGLWIPPMKLIREGKPNEDLLAIIEKNVRVPDQVKGDLMAQVAANELGGQWLLEMMESQGIDNFSLLAKEIQEISESTMRKAIGKLPQGEYTYEMATDGFDKPITLKLRLCIEGDGILLDYSGCSPQVERALNVVSNYAYAYSVYPLKCILAPDIPNNEGCFRPIRMEAPLGSILNPRFPAAVVGRVMVGQFCPAMVLGALGKALPERVPAEGGGPIWSITFSGEDENKKKFVTTFWVNHGQGAGANRDGLSVMSFPSNISNTPVEVIEMLAPVRFDAKQYIPDSGGRGKFRGGLGQQMRIRPISENQITVNFFVDRTKNAPQGLLSGQPGRRGRILLNDMEINSKKQIQITKHDVLTIELPSGGGFGDPSQRDPNKILQDLRDGLITKEK